MKCLGKPPTSKAYAGYVELGLARTDQEFIQLMRENPIAIGAESFVDDIQCRCLGMAGKRVKREDVSLRAIQHWKEPEWVERAVLSVLGDCKKLLAQRRKGAVARGFYAWALQRYAGLTQREAASWLQIGTGAGICLMIKRALPTKEFARWQSDLDLLFKG
jgi:hypothetical protein